LRLRYLLRTPHIQSLILSLFIVLTPLFTITLSIALSPWFDIFNNALSDLGHARRGVVAIIFNSGLHITGLLLIIHGLIYLRRVFPFTGPALCVNGYFMQLVALLNEVYGGVHYLISIAFFISVAITMSIYIVEGRSLTTLTVLFIGVLSWVIHFLINSPGTAIPELVSVAGMIIWYVELNYAYRTRIIKSMLKVKKRSQKKLYHHLMRCYPNPLLAT